MPRRPKGAPPPGPRTRPPSPQAKAAAHAAPKPNAPTFRQRFVTEYMVDRNATQAAIRAGYSPRSAGQQGSALLKRHEVRSAIDALEAELAAATGLSAKRVLDELALIGFSNLADFMRATPSGDLVPDFSNLTRDQAAALTEVVVEEYTMGKGKTAQDVKRTRFKLADKRAALVDLGKHLGMFVHRVGNPDGSPLTPSIIQVHLVEPDGTVVGG